MADDKNHWRGYPINAGTLVALATLFATAFVVGVGIPAWLDSRIDDRLDTRLRVIEFRVDRVEHLSGAPSSVPSEWEEEE